MSDPLSSATKYAIGTCVLLCAATVTASVIVGNGLGRVITAGYKGAKDAIKKEIDIQKNTKKNNEEYFSISVPKLSKNQS